MFDDRLTARLPQAGQDAFGMPFLMNEGCARPRNCCDDKGNYPTEAETPKQGLNGTLNLAGCLGRQLRSVEQHGDPIGGKALFRIARVAGANGGFVVMSAGELLFEWLGQTA